MDNVPPALRVLDVVITTHDMHSDAQTSDRVAFDAHLQDRNGLLAVSAIVNAPDDLEGAAYLFRQTAEGPEVYYYSPELDRVRRIAGGSGAGGIFGSALSFSDFEDVERTLRSSSITLRGVKPDDPAYIRRFVVLPSPAAETPFGRINMKVDTERCFIVEADIMNDAGERIRHIRAPREQLRNMEADFWYPGLILVENFETQRVTEAHIRDLRLPGSVPEQVFDPNAFYKGMAE
ncbi:MAG: outer membrane lipoprotein-sorting protein [Algiphilus sp.]